MSKRRRWVQPSAIETPERDAPPLATPEDAETLENREVDAPDTDDEEENEDDEPVFAAKAPEPPAMSEREVRLTAARALKPETSHWASVWASGRNAAVTALESGTPLAAVYALAPPEGAGCRDCWQRGRDAALRIIQGV